MKFGSGMQLSKSIILLYNEEIKKVASEFNIPFFDAFSLLAPHPEYKVDAFHLNPEGKRLFGMAIAEKLKDLLKK